MSKTALISQIRANNLIMGILLNLKWEFRRNEKEFSYK